MNDYSKTGFTVIELLILVTVITIVCLCAWPSYKQAAVASDVAEAKNDMHIINIALDGYRTDWQSYPPCIPSEFSLATNNYFIGGFVTLSTPVAYLSDPNLGDPFVPTSYLYGLNAEELVNRPEIEFNPSETGYTPWSYLYGAWDHDSIVFPYDLSGRRPNSIGYASAATLQSAGPDLKFHGILDVITNDTSVDGPILLIYDASNGTISFGSIYRSTGSATPTEGFAAGQGMIQAITTQQSPSIVNSWTLY